MAVVRSLQLFACCAIGMLLLLPGGCGATQISGGHTDAGAPSGGDADVPSAGASSGGVGNAGAPAAAVPCVNDEVCLPGGQLCDQNRQVCVDCRSTSDCEEGSLCQFGACVHVMKCKDSRDCDADEVCNEDIGVCVQCVVDTDCADTEGAVCVNAVCHNACKSDKDCVAVDQLCDEPQGYCVNCAKDGDCAEGEYCVLSYCRPQACQPGAASCMGDQLLECETHGGAYVSTSCAEGCSDAGGPHCESGAGGAPAGGASAGGASAGGAGGTDGAGEAGASGAGMAGEGGAGGSSECANREPDSIKVPSCGTPGSSTRDAYSGVITITVSGLVQNEPGVIDDAFYELNAADLTKSTKACTGCLVYNRASEGSCLCSFECGAASHYVTDFLVGPYPAFNPSHTYTVQLDLGSAPAQALNFGYADCGCSDNAGNYNLTVDCAP